MKHLILALVVSVLSVQASAAPSHAQGKESRIVARYELSGGGFLPPGAISRTMLEVSSNGEVRKVEVYPNGRRGSLLIAQLSAHIVDVLVANVEATSSGELRDSEPNKPECQDAPSHSYTAFRKSGEGVKLLAVVNCKNYSKSNTNSADISIIQTLNNLNEITNLRLPLQ